MCPPIAARAICGADVVKRFDELPDVTIAKAGHVYPLLIAWFTAVSKLGFLK